MNKIAIMGFSQEEIDIVSSVLFKVGVKRPLLSKKKRHSSQKILELISQHREFDKSNNSTHPLIDDFLLANEKHNIWTWSDSKLIQFLDLLKYYNFKFIYVYSSPFEHGTMDFIEKAQLDNWVSYNQCMLNFFENNKEHIILVNFKYFNDAPIELLNEIVSKFKVTIRIPKVIKLPPIKRNYINFSNERSEIYGVCEKLYLQLEKKTSIYLNKVMANASELILNNTDQKLNIHNEGMEMSSLNYKLVSEKSISVEHQIEELTSVGSLQDTNKTGIGRMAEEANRLFHVQLSAIQLELEQSYKDKLAMQFELDQLKKQVKNLGDKEQNSTKNIATNTDVFLAEKKVLSDKLQGKVDEFDKLLNAHSVLAGELTNYKTRVEELELSIAGEIALKNDSLRQLRKEMESLFLNSQKNGKPPSKKQTVLNSEERLYGAAYRVKQQLPYQVGSLIIRNAKTFDGIVKTPLDLTKMVWLYHRHQKKLEQELPPLENYADVADVVSVEQHLSFRLGKVFVDNYTHPLKWISMPWQAYNVVRDFNKKKIKK